MGNLRELMLGTFVFDGVIEQIQAVSGISIFITLLIDDDNVHVPYAFHKHDRMLLLHIANQIVTLCRFEFAAFRVQRALFLLNHL